MTLMIERALVYVRTSNSASAGSHGDLISQGKRLLDHCAQRQIDVVHIYRDEARSGTCKDRPGLRSLIEHAMRPGGGITEIAVESLSRLCRNRDVLELYRGRLKKAGVRIVAVTEDADLKAGSDIALTNRLAS